MFLLVTALAIASAGADSGSSKRSTITTVAGTGVSCTLAALPCGDGGPAKDALLAAPMSAAPTSDGGYLVADRDVPRIRKVTKDGQIINLAGTGQVCTTATVPVNPCGDNGPAVEATMHIPHDVIFDPSDGGFIVADRGDNRVRKVGPDGIIHTIAGNGKACSPHTDICGDGGLATEAEITSPQGLSLIPGGGLLVTGEDDRIRKVDTSGRISTVAGTGAKCPKSTDPCGDGGEATKALFNDPHGVVAVDGNTFLISDRKDNRVRRVSKDGKIRTVAGSGIKCEPSTARCGDNGPALHARFHFAVEVVPRGKKAFYVVDTRDNRVRYVNDAGQIKPVAGTGARCFPITANCGDRGPALDGKLLGPHGAGIVPGGLLVADRDDNRIRFVSAPLPR